MKSILLVLVEDDPNLGNLYDEELSDEGYHVLRAGNGREGVEMSGQIRPDISVTDINMPGMDGLEMIERMLAAQPGLPVIVNSAYDSYSAYRRMRYNHFLRVPSASASASGGLRQPTPRLCFAFAVAHFPLSAI